MKRANYDLMLQQKDLVSTVQRLFDLREVFLWLL